MKYFCKSCYRKVESTGLRNFKRVQMKIEEPTKIYEVVVSCPECRTKVMLEKKNEILI